MTYEWSPEPTPEEREALERALEGVLDGEPDPRGAWWRAGLDEALALGGSDEAVAMPSRQTLLEPELVRLEHEPGREALPAEEP